VADAGARPGSTATPGGAVFVKADSGTRARPAVRLKRAEERIYYVIPSEARNLSLI
jgi:hypothetical protein